MSNWTKFDKAFNQVSAYIVLDKDSKEVIAKIALKYPRDGAGRLSCYMHIIGNEVQIGTASGYGYDKRTSAIINAISKYNDMLALQIKSGHVSFNSKIQSFINHLVSDKAQSGWQEVINENNGFIVIQSI